MGPPRLEAAPRFAATTVWAQHETFILRPQVITEQPPVPFQSEAKQARVAESCIFYRVYEVSNRLPLPDQCVAAVPSCRALSLLVESHAESIGLDERTDVLGCD